ncbi:MAG: sulfonate transport system substrate-binding protein [Alphaproteobacteria bacterium]|nr:sulfonate transport system substrate-binding protein [Alphaproteobacteria bacterium]
MSKFAKSGVLILALMSWMAALEPGHAQGTTIHVGYFPNVTHVHAMIARNMERNGRDWFAGRLGPGIKVEWHAYKAGPAAMQAMLARSLDLTYAGPSSILSAYAASRGEEIRIVAGAVNGGSALVVQPRSNLAKAADFRGKRMATPEVGNTQDVTARAWLAAGGLRVAQRGGDVQILPTANPDQLALFQLLQVDAVWTVEPWVSRLELLADGKILVEEKDEITTLLASSVHFLSSQRDLARRFVAAHRALTDWIRNNPDEAQRMITDEFLAAFDTKMSKVLLAQAWKRIALTSDVSPARLQVFSERAQKAGFTQNTADLSRLVEPP